MASVPVMRHQSRLVHALCSMSGEVLSVDAEVSLPVALYSVLDVTCSYYRAPRFPEFISCPGKTLSIVDFAVLECVSVFAWCVQFIPVTG